MNCMHGGKLFVGVGKLKARDAAGRIDVVQNRMSGRRLVWCMAKNPWKWNCVWKTR